MSIDVHFFVCKFLHVKCQNLARTLSKIHNKCSRFKSHSLLSCFPPYITAFDIKIHQKIQTMHSHASICHHCNYCNVDFVLFHNVACYTHYHLLGILVNTTKLFNTMYFGCHKHVITEFRVYMWSKADKTIALTPNPKFMTINTKSPKFFSMLELLYTKSGGMLFIINFIACPTRMGGPS